MSFCLECNHENIKTGLVLRINFGLTTGGTLQWELFWILGRGLRRALIRCTLGSGKSEKGLGFWRGGHKGAMGDKGEQFTDNLGPRWTIPVTTGGCQVSRRGG